MGGKNRRIWVWVILAAVPGCNGWSLSPQTASPPAVQQGSGDAFLGKTGVKNEAPGDNSSAVETALALSDKQAKLTEELLAAQQARRDLEESNRKATAQSAKLQSDLEAAQKELAEANQMLVEMKKELENWKSNVLGFRDEIRKAQKAELDSLRKVLVILGAEAPPAAAAPTTQSSTQPAELQARAGM
jgi:hypothetical protein